MLPCARVFRNQHAPLLTYLFIVHLDGVARSYSVIGNEGQHARPRIEHHRADAPRPLLPESRMQAGVYRCHGDHSSRGRH